MLIEKTIGSKIPSSRKQALVQKLQVLWGGPVPCALCKGISWDLHENIIVFPTNGESSGPMFVLLSCARCNNTHAISTQGLEGFLVEHEERDKTNEV